MELQVGVKILLRDKEGKYLMVRRSSDKYPEVGSVWDIPGGRINPGSTLLENLKREVSEEVGLDLPGEPKLIAAQDILRVSGRHVVRLTYLGEAEGVVKLNEENTEFQWFKPEDLKKLQGVDIYLRELLEKGNL